MHTCYSPVRRSPAGESKLSPPMPLDLHVLSLSLAFILSQDQTLRCCYIVFSFFSIKKAISFLLLPSQSLATNSETSAPGLSPELFAVYCVLRIERSRCRDLLGLAPVLLLSIVIVSMCSFVPFGRRIGVLRESDCKVNASFSNHQIFVRFLTLVFSFGAFRPPVRLSAPPFLRKASAKLQLSGESTKYF